MKRQQSRSTQEKRDTRLHEGYALNGTRVHRFTEEALDRGEPFVEALCRQQIRRPIVPVTFEGGMPYCSPCERKAAKHA